MSDETTIETPATQDNTDEPAPIETPEPSDLMGGEATPGPAVEETTEETTETVVPETYEDFTLADGYDMTPEQKTAFSDIAKGLNLTQELAQKLIDFDVKRQVDMAEANRASFEKQANEWVAESRKEYGDQFPEKLAVATKAYQTFFDVATQKIFTDSGMNNNSGFFRSLVKLGESISEDSFVKGGAAVKGKNEGGMRDAFLDLNTKN